MKTRFLISVLLIFIVVGFGFAATFRPDPEKYGKETLLGYKTELMSKTKYEESDFFKVNTLSLYGEANAAFDIYSRMRKLSIDEDFIKKAKAYQNMALIRILVDNGTLTSISQLPIVAMEAYSELPVKEKALAAYKGDKRDLYSAERDFDPGDYYDKTEVVTVEIDPKEYYQNYVRLLDAVATYALIGKYPNMTQKYVNDYVVKHGVNVILLEYLIDNGEYDFAINLSGKSDSSKHFKTLTAIAYAKKGDMKKALEISDEISRSIGNGVPDERVQAWINIIYLYKYSGTLSENKEKILNIENEIIMIAREENVWFPISDTKEIIVNMEKGDLFNYISSTPGSMNSGLEELTFLGKYEMKYIFIHVGDLNNISDIGPSFSFSSLKHFKERSKERSKGSLNQEEL